MKDKEILAILKTDLQIAADQYDKYLKSLIHLAKEAITKEGITIQDDVEDGMLVEMYAAYLYRKRKENVAGMPRMLRYMLNNRLLSEKMGG